MKINTEVLLSICDKLIVKNNLENKCEYSWIDIVGISEPSDVGTKLIFATYSEENDWNFSYDRRLKVLDMIKAGHHVVVDFETDLTNTIQVSSLWVFALEIFLYSRKYSHPKIIGITGSVGKTTTVAFLEDLLAFSSKKVVRFFSKRITPWSLLCHFINKVDKDTEFVVLEYSLFYAHHVEVLANILPPDIAFMINIENMHIEQRLLGGKEDIFQAKSKIFVQGKSEKLYINKDISNFSNPKLSDFFIFECNKSINLEDSNFLPPTQRTRELFTVAEIVCKEFSIPMENLFCVFRDFVPKEKRIFVVNTQNKKIFFSGESSTAPRILSFLQVDYPENVFLFIETINFSEADPLGFKDDLDFILRRKNTFILDSQNNRNKLSFIEDLIFLEEKYFIETFVGSRGYVVYHSGLSVRKIDFSVENHIHDILINLKLPSI